MIDDELSDRHLELYEAFCLSTLFPPSNQRKMTALVIVGWSFVTQPPGATWALSHSSLCMSLLLPLSETFVRYFHGQTAWCMTEPEPVHAKPRLPWTRFFYCVDAFHAHGHSKQQCPCNPRLSLGLCLSLVVLSLVLFFCVAIAATSRSAWPS